MHVTLTAFVPPQDTNAPLKCASSMQQPRGVFPLAPQTWVPGFLFSGRYESLCAGVKDWALEANKESLQSLYGAPKETGWCVYRQNVPTASLASHAELHVPVFCTLLFLLSVALSYLPFDFSPDDWWLVKYRNHFGHLAFCLYLFLPVYGCWGHLLVITFSFFSTKNINTDKKKPQKSSLTGRCTVWSLTSFLPKSLWQQRLNTYHNRQEAMLCSDWLVKSRTRQRSHRISEIYFTH